MEIEKAIRKSMTYISKLVYKWNRIDIHKTCAKIYELGITNDNLWSYMKPETRRLHCEFSAHHKYENEMANGDYDAAALYIHEFLGFGKGLEICYQFCEFVQGFLCTT